MAKRFTKPSINWVEIEKRYPPEQKNNYLAFRAKSAAYLQRVQANPAEMPKIDWEAYKKLIPQSNIVEKLKSALEKYKIPYPKDIVTSQIDAQWKKIEKDIQQYCAEQQKHIDAASKELKRIQSLPKFEDMTMEMFYYLYPDKALDPVNRPTYWPHNPEEQPGYVTPEVKTSKTGH
ncbi:ATP synthase subunit d, mitochondrial [Papilio xuthus]|uniref:ATP synthase subunit d, mitochondrial n=1 Tax=Papilio xuthus TaxID=66420 RepID=A0A194PFZ3_PAPXU|nr:ATP synthase subunit d, mitochondrial [Papilio xuthus]